MKSWLNSSVEDWESFSSRDVMGCTEHSSTCSTEIDDPLYMRRLSQGDLSEIITEVGIKGKIS